MKKIFIALVFLLSNISVTSQVADKIQLTTDHQLLGLGKQYVISSKILNEERPIIVSLPKYYEDTNSNYPVMYVLDGLQNIKHIVGTVELLTESGIIAPMIIVGIESLDRARDLTPSNAGKNVNGGAGNSGIPQSGGAPKFLDFMSSELIPFIEQNFKTLPYRILQGHSFGGLFGGYAMMEKPDLFDAYMIQSPAFWWNNEEMTQKAKTFFKNKAVFNKRIYFGIGEDDGWGMKQELKRFIKVFEEQTPKNFVWKHEEIPDEDHMSARLLLNYNGLKYIFKELRMKQVDITSFKKEDFTTKEEKLIQKFGDNVRRPAGDYIALASALINANKNEEGIVVLERAIKGFPMYVGIQTYLSKILEKTGQYKKAIEMLNTAIKTSKRYKLGQEEDIQQEINRIIKMYKL